MIFDFIRDRIRGTGMFCSALRDDVAFLRTKDPTVGLLQKEGLGRTDRIHFKRVRLAVALRKREIRLSLITRGRRVMAIMSPVTLPLLFLTYLMLFIGFLCGFRPIF